MLICNNHRQAGAIDVHIILKNIKTAKNKISKSLDAFASTLLQSYRKNKIIV
jgi:hypothetical protein